MSSDGGPGVAGGGRPAGAAVSARLHGLGTTTTWAQSDRSMGRLNIPAGQPPRWTANRAHRATGRVVGRTAADCDGDAGAAEFVGAAARQNDSRSAARRP